MMPIKRENLPVIILLSILTCGIYWLVFIYRTTKNVNQMAGADGKTMNPALTILFSIFCGIYAIYWYFVIQKRLQVVSANNNIRFNTKGPLFFLLAGAGYVLNAKNVFSFFTNLADYAVSGGSLPTVSPVGAILLYVGIFGAYIILVQNLNQVIDAYNKATVSQGL